jgi:hypothetical protein
MMLRKDFLILGFVAILAFGAAGCDRNPTNAPSKEDVKKADDARLKAIENDPNLTPEQKEMQKKMMGLAPGGRGPARTPPTGQ